MTKAEPLKPQAWEKCEVCGLDKADCLWWRHWALSEQPSPETEAKMKREMAAHAPSGSPLTDMIRRLLYAHPDKLLKKEAEALLHKHYYDTRSAADQELSEGMAKLGEEALGSVASQEARFPQPHATRSIVELIRTPSITVEAAVDLLIHWIKRQSWASQEAAQPIPSIADVSDHNPNDPSCKACGSAMGWKCLSCGSTTEPTQEAAQPMTGFPIDKTDDWEERQDRVKQAGTPAKE